MRFFFSVFGTVVAMVIAAVAFSGYSQKWDYSQPRATVHKVFTKSGGSASGVMIAPMLMLTAAHVAEQPGLYVGQQRATVRVLRSDKKKDLALLLVAVGCPCATITTRPPEIDERLITVGYPMNNLVGAQVLTEGRYQGVGRDGFMSITPPVGPGNSGGGVFVFDGIRWSLAGITDGVVVGMIHGQVPSFLPHLASASSTQSMHEFLTRRSAEEVRDKFSIPIPGIEQKNPTPKSRWERKPTDK